MIEKNWLIGLWKFNSNISTEELGEIAKQWANEDSKYLQLYIRKVSKDQIGIGFTYDLGVESNDQVKEAHNEYFNRLTDSLKRKFGNDLVGWDMASPVWIIKDALIDSESNS